MANSSTTVATEAEKATSMSQPPIPQVQLSPEPEVDSASAFGQRLVDRVGGSPQTPPSRYGSILSQTEGAPTRRTSALRQLQRTYGNQYVGRIIQAKLTVGQPGDVYEQEADRVADQIARMPDSAPPSSVRVSEQIQPLRIQRLCTECEEEEQIQRLCTECEEEEPIQPKEAAGQTPAVTPGLEARLDTTRGSGQPLPKSVRSDMESRFGTDFSRVRVHADSEAAALNRDLKAQAFTRHRDIYFGTGKYSPDSKAGQHLLAHELTHVVQQSCSFSTPFIQRDWEEETEDSAQEETLKPPQVDAAMFVDDMAAGGPTTEASESLRQAWIAEIEYFLQHADADFAIGMVGIVDSPEETEYWQKFEEDTLQRAYHFRVALILRDGSFADREELNQLIDNADDWAKDEEKTLEGGRDWFAEDYPDAFPATWSRRVASDLNPPADLEATTARAEFSKVSIALGKALRAMGPDVYAQGLPVPFGEALSLRSFSFKLSYASLSKPKSIRDVARQAKRWIEAAVKHWLAESWLGGKQTLVTDIAVGRKVINPATWSLVSDRRNYQPDLERLVSEAFARDVEIFPVLAADFVEGWEYELALAKLAAYAAPAQESNASSRVSDLFRLGIAAADRLVAKTDTADRIDVANRWASNWGYSSAALSTLYKAVKDNAGQIAKDIAKDVIMSLIPGVNLIWWGKEVVEEVNDLYQAGVTLDEARDRVRAATTVVSLQRAAAQMIMAEYSGAATVAMTAVSAGVSAGSSAISKKVRQRQAKAADDGTSAPPKAAPEVQVPSNPTARVDAPDLEPGRVAQPTTPEVSPDRSTLLAGEAGDIPKTAPEGPVPSNRAKHFDEPKLEPGVLAQHPASDGHTLKLLQDGRIVRCTTCSELKDVFAAELSDPENAELKEWLELIEQEPDSPDKLMLAAEVEGQLAKIRKGTLEGEIKTLNEKIEDLRRQMEKLGQKRDAAKGEAKDELLDRVRQRYGPLASKEQELLDAQTALKAIRKTLSRVALILNPKRGAQLPCFSEDTLVWTVEGPKRIDKIQVGEKVLSFDFDRNTVVEREVREVLVNQTVCFYEIEVGSESISATRSHPFWVVNQWEWIAARDLKTGMQLLHWNGQWVEITAIERQEVTESTTYNLSIEQTPNYFVGPGVLVHNEGEEANFHLGPYIVYEGTNPRFPDKVYIGITKDLEERKNRHISEAKQNLADRSKLDARHVAYYEFKEGMDINPKVMGIKNFQHAEFLEQTNIDIETEIGDRTVINLKNPTVSEARMEILHDEIKNDPDVRAKGYC